MKKTTESNRVWIGGTGVVSVLGTGVEANVSRIRAYQLPAVGGEGGSRFTFRDAADWRRDELPAPVCRAVREATRGLDKADLADTAVLVGTSSFDVGCWEGRYRDRVSGGEADYVPMHAHCGTLAAQVARFLGSHARQWVINTACTSSANALLQAARLIQIGQVRHALVVGIEIGNVVTQLGFESLMLLSQNRLRPFDRDRDGMVLGEGVAAVHLSADSDHRQPLRLAAAHSVSDVTNLTASSSQRVADVIDGVLSKTGRDVVAVKGHGTGTPASDLAEAGGMRAAFRDKPPPLTSIKPYFGHTLGAAGALETAVFAECLRAGFIPGTPSFRTTDPELGLAPFTRHRAAEKGHYLLNFFGFGGSTTALLVEKL